MKKVPVKIKLFEPEMGLPAYQSDLAVGFDLYARIDMEILPSEIKLIPLNFAIEIPSDYWLMVCARSSLHKMGLMMINGVGVGDPDYCGDEDEYRLLVRNFSDQITQVKKGDRLAQGILMPRLVAEFKPVTSLAHNQNRGGFGSTGRS